MLHMYVYELGDDGMTIKILAIRIRMRDIITLMIMMMGIVIPMTVIV